MPGIHENGALALDAGGADPAAANSFWATPAEGVPAP